MTDKLNELQRYFSSRYRAKERAKIKNVMVNGKIATVTFTEYQAPKSDVEEFRKYDGSDGHYYYLVVTTRTDYINTYYNSAETVSEIYLTDKQEGNEIYKQIKATGTLNI